MLCEEVFLHLEFGFMAADAQKEVPIAVPIAPLPEKRCAGSTKPKHPCQGGENRAVRDGRDRFLHFLKEENNDNVS